MLLAERGLPSKRFYEGALSSAEGRALSEVLEPGSYSMRVRYGTHDVEKAIEIRPGQTMRVDVDLTDDA